MIDQVFINLLVTAKPAYPPICMPNDMVWYIINRVVFLNYLIVNATFISFHLTSKLVGYLLVGHSL